MLNFAKAIVALSILAMLMRVAVTPDAVIPVSASLLNYLSGFFMGWAIASPYSFLRNQDAGQ